MKRVTQIQLVALAMNTKKRGLTKVVVTKVQNVGIGLFQFTSEIVHYLIVSTTPTSMFLG